MPEVLCGRLQDIMSMDDMGRDMLYGKEDTGACKLNDMGKTGCCWCC